MADGKRGLEGGIFAVSGLHRPGKVCSSVCEEERNTLCTTILCSDPHGVKIKLNLNSAPMLPP